MLGAAAIFSVSSSLGYLLPAIIGLESMGVPSPGETALVLAAVLASQGKLQIELVIAIIVHHPAIIGDNIGYLARTSVGREVLEAPGPLEHRRRRLIAVGDRFFDRHGPKAVFFARWVALSGRGGVARGINHMPLPGSSFFWNALGAAHLAAITFGLVGYFGGQVGAPT